VTFKETLKNPLATIADGVAGAYIKPATGVPLQDLEVSTQQSLIRADQAVQFSDLYVAELIEVNPQTANYTITSTDVGRVIEVNSATAVNVFVPPNSADPIPVYSWTKVRQVGAGQVTVVPDTANGVTVNGPDSLTTRAQWCTLTLHKRSTNGWVIEGDASTTSAPPPASTVAFGAVNAGASENAGDGIVNFTYTPATGDTLVFVDIAVGKGSGGAASTYTRGVTYNGQPMTSLGAVNSNNSTSGFVESFYTFITSTAAAPVVVTITGGSGANPRTIIAAAVSYAGAGSLGTPVTGFTNTAGTPSVTVSSAANHLVHAAFASGGTIASPTDTQRVLNNLTNINSAGNLLIQDQAGAGSAVLGAASNSDNWAWIAVDVVPGSPPPPSQLPDILSIIPNPGPAGAVTITGSNFITGATISFGGAAATGVTVVSSTQINCTAPAHADGNVNVTVTTSAGTSDTYVFTYQGFTFDPAQVQFTGDFSTGNATQWPWIDVKGYSGATSGLAAAISGGSVPAYSVQFPTDASAPSGKAMRVELRSGDPRCEVASNSGNNTLAGGFEGDTRWYEFGLKFDQSFPNNHNTLGWGLCTQFKCPGLGSPMVAWYMDRVANCVSLTITPQSGPAVYIGSQYSLYDIPLPRTTWVWITMKILHSVNTSVGTVELWVNQQRATFKDGTQLHRTATLIPNCQVQPVNSFLKQGYYRNPSIAATGIIYHSGARVCYTSAGLSRPVS
jgi:Polysaccharide lyase/IPT/TIG domain